MSLNASHLILEVTRKCNMCCDHCLRGEPQKQDMTKVIINKVLDTFESICTVTFTGGEPTLNLDLIRYFFNEADKRGKLPSSFWLATNGKENQIELAALLLEYYPLVDEPECCGVAVSKDYFHDEPKINYLAGLSFYDSSKEHDIYNPDDSWLIKSGNAELYDLGSQEKADRRSQNLYLDAHGNNNFTIEQVYVNALGDVIPDCDYSYIEQEKMKLCHIDDLVEYIHLISETKTA